MDCGQPIRFLKSAPKYKDFKKGDKGIIQRILSVYPFATADIYIVETEGKRVWATSQELEAWNQLSLL